MDWAVNDGHAVIVMSLNVSIRQFQAWWPD